MPRPTTLNFITGNANKLAEVQAIMSEVHGLTLQSKAVDLPELQGSIEEISLDKARRAADVVGFAVLCL
jgi:inosine triphosphate pyrophosphatase